MSAMPVKTRPQKKGRRKIKRSQLTHSSSSESSQPSRSCRKEQPTINMCSGSSQACIGRPIEEWHKKNNPIDVFASSSKQWSQTSQSSGEKKETDAWKAEGSLASAGEKDRPATEKNSYSPIGGVIASSNKEWCQTSQSCRTEEPKETGLPEVQNLPVSSVEKDSAIKKCSSMGVIIVSSSKEWSQTSQSCGEKNETAAPEVKNESAGDNDYWEAESDTSRKDEQKFSNQDHSKEGIEESLQPAVKIADLTCSACLKPFKDPKVLPCLHSYCHGCIVNLAKNTDTINCPKCRLVVKVDENTASGLPPNFFVNNLLLTVALTNDNPTAKEILCDNCDSEDAAQSRCNECGIFLCQYCTESHKRYRSTKHHKLFSMEELKSNSGPQTIAQKIRCQKHKEETIKLFCKTCQTTICLYCTIVDHRQHEYEFVEEVAFKEKQHLQSNLNDVKERNDRVEQGIANLKKLNESLEDQKNSTISDINRHFDELMKAAEFRKSEMIQKAISLTNAKQKQVQAQLQVLEVASANCKSSIEFTELAFKSGNDVQILSMERNILQSLQELKVIKDQTKPCVTEGITFVIPSSVQETKKKLLNQYDVFNCVASSENCHAFFNEVETTLPKEAEAFNNYSIEQELGDKLKDEQGLDCAKAKTFIEAGKQYFITLICNDKNNGRLKCGGDDIKPSFTGMDVNDVAVADNKDGSYSISFCPRQGGILKFEVSINGVSAPNCSLTKQVRWVISGAHGKGVITDGGRTIKGEVGEGKYCWRVGGCYFESGVHTWKVRLSWQDNYKREVGRKNYNHYGHSYNTLHSNAVEVGVIDSNEIVNYNEINQNSLQTEKKWVYTRSVEDRHDYDNEIFFTLDMENRTLKVKEKLSYFDL